MLAPHVSLNGKHGLELTVMSVPKPAYDMMYALLSGTKRVSEDDLGVTKVFAKRMTEANAFLQSPVSGTTHDHYQHDPEEQALMYLGRLYQDKQEVPLTDELLLQLARHIVEHTRQLLESEQYIADSAWLDTPEARHRGHDQEIIVNYMHMYYSRAVYIRALKTTFEVMLRKRVGTLISVFFDQDDQKKYRAFINGPDLDPRKIVRKMNDFIREVQSEVIGVHPEEDVGSDPGRGAAEAGPQGNEEDEED